MDSASYHSARRFGWVPQDSTTSTSHFTGDNSANTIPDDAEPMNPWAETSILSMNENDLAYWVPFTNDLPPTIIKRQQQPTPIQVSPKLKYPMMVALTVATISSGSILQALSAPAKAAPSGNDGTGSFQPVDATPEAGEITAAPADSGDGTTYSVQPGDTLRDIAAQYGVDVSTLVTANGLANPDLIYPGDQIFVPASASFTESVVSYTVQPGDSLRSIATAHGVSHTAIINYEANGITDPDLILPGQELSIPGATAPVVSEPVAQPQQAEAETTAVQEWDAPPEPSVYYTVQPGDSLQGIANAHGVSQSAIINYGPNGISNADLIYPGQELGIPGGVAPVVSEPVVQPQQADPEPVVEPAPEVVEVSGVAYTVQAGDSLQSIADAHGVSRSAIVNHGPNGIANADLIYPGQELLIPGGTTPVASEVVSEPEPAPQVQAEPEPQPEPVAQANPEPAPEPVSAAPAPSGVGQQIVNLAMQFQGAPYVWGAVGPSSFDCTGFTYYIVNQITGGGFPRDMYSQAAYGTPVSADNLQPGDIVFQQNTYQAGMSHAGIYIGGGQFINAANPSVGVVISNLWDDYWGPRYHSAIRI